jgi:hypothetical protein
MKFLVEKVCDDLITEQTRDKKYYIKGVFAQAEVKNRNGRSYPRQVMENALSNYMKVVEDRRAIGELNHPNHPQPNLERASHIIESLTWDGNNIMGKARVMTEMPMGKIAKGLIDEGVKIGVSTRGLGSLVERNGMNIVQNDFTMTAIDIVGDPSAPDAFVEGIMENANWIYDASSNSWMIAEQIKKEVKRMSNKQLAEAQSKLFEMFLKSIQ